MAKVVFENRPQGWGSVLDREVNGKFVGKTLKHSEPVGEKAGSVLCLLTDEQGVKERIWLDPVKLPTVSIEPFALVEDFECTIVKGAIASSRAI